MRYEIVSVDDGKVLMTAPDIESATKVIDMMGDGYKVIPIEKRSHNKQFNKRR